jgi:prepilin-type N-terminal cleavage/methylation domain-containing protein
MRNTKNAFTLVELIVVITILAILGTIAFISLQWYSADARNSKRTSDVSNILSKMNIWLIDWVPIMSFIADNTKALTWADLGWNTGITDVAEYKAWIPNYTVLNVVPKDFKDPKSDEDYAIGATTYAGWVFEVAATFERDGTETGEIKWTFNPRDTTPYDGTVSDSSFTLDDENANRFKLNDSVTITHSWGTETDTANITKVSRDGITLTFDVSGLTVGSGSVVLNNPESGGLINGVDPVDGLTTDTPVTNWSTTSLPY